MYDDENHLQCYDAMMDRLCVTKDRKNNICLNQKNELENIKQNRDAN